MVTRSQWFWIRMWDAIGMRLGWLARRIPRRLGRRPLVRAAIKVENVGWRRYGFVTELDCSEYYRGVKEVV